MSETRFEQWLNETERRLADLDRRLAEWLDQPIDIARLSEEIARITQDRARDRRYQAALADVYEVIEATCRRYLEANAQHRARIRQAVVGKQNILHSLMGYIGYASYHLNSMDDSDWLRIGLAGAAIEDAQIDMRDTILALERLYRKAADLGMEPRSQFEKVAALASDEPGTGALANTSMKALLRSFHTRMPR
ncbi:MAG: hypothetical protein AB1696_11645 [Planctomycetota bacterium]